MNEAQCVGVLYLLGMVLVIGHVTGYLQRVEDWFRWLWWWCGLGRRHRTAWEQWR